MYLNTNGEEIHYDNWKLLEPDNFKIDGLDQDAVKLDPAGDWNDAFVSDTAHFICVIDPRSFSIQSK